MPAALARASAALVPLLAGCLGASVGSQATSSPRPSASSVTFGTLKRWIAERDVRSVDELLVRLPESFRSRYVLMFRSRSPESASYECPRAILYGEDARFVVAFNGAGSPSSSDLLQTMEFDEQNETFHFREIAFPPAGMGGEITLSDDTPARCSACHGSPARPIWDAYPSWPGAYGEHEHEAPGPLERGSRGVPHDPAHESPISEPRWSGSVGED